mgnify:CR=1 FL=1
MIRKLRVKLVCILMALLTVMLGVTFGLVLHFTQQSLEAESLLKAGKLRCLWSITLPTITPTAAMAPITPPRSPATLRPAV